jgi:hypothetical protein
MARELGRAVEMGGVANAVARAFGAVFSLEPCPVDPRTLSAAPGASAVPPRGSDGSPVP